MRLLLLVLVIALSGGISGVFIPSLFGLFRRQRQKNVPAHPENVTVDLLVEKLRKDIENLKRQSELGFEREVRVDSEKSYDTHYIFGVRHRGLNVSAFCGALTRKQLAHIPHRRRDAVLFTPAQELPSSLSNVVVSIPRMWFREYDKGHRLPGIPIFFCYEGINFLRLMPLTIYQSDLTANGDFMEYKHHHQFNSNLSLRGAALILDRTWNNAYLVPKSHKATLTADSYHDRRRHAITRYCTPSLLRNQECCLWRYRSVLSVHGQKKDIVFNRCIGKIPVEQTKFPFVSESHEEIAVRGGMSRRLFVPVPKVVKKECRESRFRLYQLTIDDPKHGKISKTLDRLDAIECAVFY
ncbi:hypothetical protein Q1695_015296 [Nippostrongylus brasiliensis]|nr:hypothetical protein Q1695_015296 [Nippostrongylus brasiliensis]